MIIVSKEEYIKRGCAYCMDSEVDTHKHRLMPKCKHDTCPYHELDSYNTYDQYLENNGLYLSFLEL